MTVFNIGRRRLVQQSIRPLGIISNELLSRRKSRSSSCSSKSFIDSTISNVSKNRIFSSNYFIHDDLPKVSISHSSKSFIDSAIPNMSSSNNCCGNSFIDYWLCPTECEQQPHQQIFHWFCHTKHEQQQLSLQLYFYWLSIMPYKMWAAVAAANLSSILL